VSVLWDTENNRRVEASGRDNKPQTDMAVNTSDGYPGLAAKAKS